jgi:hypothetical protein
MRLLPPATPGHHYPRVTSARLLSALFDLAVGLRLLWPDDVLGSTGGYRLLALAFRGDVPLGVALLAFGAAQAAGLYTDRHGRVVDVATWLAMITWGLIGVLLAVTNPSQLGTLAYTLAAAIHAFAYAHLLAWRGQLRCPGP